MTLFITPGARPASDTLRKSVITVLATLCGVSLVPVAEAGEMERSLGDLTGSWQLFVDDYLVASREGAVRSYHPFEKHAGNPIMVPDRPWEGTNIYIYGSVLPGEDGGGYRMWYHALPGDEDYYRLLYATSEDGLHWDKPELGLVEHQGARSNNIFIRRGKRDHIPSVIHTPWEGDSARRYAMINYDGVAGGYMAAWSPDGIRWTDASDKPVFDQGGDVGQFVWDPYTKQYLGFVKLSTEVSGMRRRSVGRIASRDITDWPDPLLILAPDAFDDRWAEGIQRTSFYGLSAFAYESMYLGFLWVFRADDRETGFLDGIIFVELVTSRDGVNWLRQEGDRMPILPVGPPDSWDDGMVFTPQHPLVDGDEIKLFYSGFDCTHAAKPPWHGAIGLATLRKDGFVSLDAGDATGIVTTKSLAGMSGSLRVNYAARPEGWLKVEVLDDEGNVVPGWDRSSCQVMEGDYVQQAVTWADHPMLPTGRSPMSLRFIMKRCSIYSFTAGDTVAVIDEPAPTPPGVLLTFEKDRGKVITDKLTEDGSQKVVNHGGSKVDTDGKQAAFGQQFLQMQIKHAPWGPLELEGTRQLGHSFTLALMARSQDNKPVRLFSAHQDTGPVRTSEIVFDCDPKGQSIQGLRLICKGIDVQSKPVRFDDDRYHHLAVVYERGDITFYLDGGDVGHGRLPGGEPVSLDHNLFVGEDATHGRQEQFRGLLDDVLVLGRALSAEEIARIAQKGASSVFQEDDSHRSSTSRQ